MDQQQHEHNTSGLWTSHSTYFVHTSFWTQSSLQGDEQTLELSRQQTRSLCSTISWMWQWVLCTLLCCSSTLWKQPIELAGHLLGPLEGPWGNPWNISSGIAGEVKTRSKNIAKSCLVFFRTVATSPTVKSVNLWTSASIQHLAAAAAQCPSFKDGELHNWQKQWMWRLFDINFVNNFVRHQTACIMGP